MQMCMLKRMHMRITHEHGRCTYPMRNLPTLAIANQTSSCGSEVRPPWRVRSATRAHQRTQSLATENQRMKRMHPHRKKGNGRTRPHYAR